MKRGTDVHVVKEGSYTNKVLRNAYMLLALTLIPTGVGAVIGTSISWAFFAGSPILSTLMFLGCMYGLMFAVQSQKDTQVGFYLLFLFTFFMGVTLGPILQVALSVRQGGSLILCAAGMTAITFFSLSAWITTTGKDLRGLGQFLFVGAVVLMTAILASLFFNIPALQLAIVAAIAIFSVVGLAYSISNAVHGGETNYVMLTLSLYLDLFNLFISLLRLLLAFSGRD